MKEFNVIEMGKKGQLSVQQQTLKSFVFRQLVDIAANQFILSMKIGSSNIYKTKD